MGTRSFIGMKRGKFVDYIYCHLDGYIEGVGFNLLKNYNTSEAVKKLIKNGDLYSLKTSLEKSEKLEPRNHYSTVSFGDYIKFNAEEDKFFDIEYFYLFDEEKQGWHYCELGKGFILNQKLEFSYDERKLLQDTKKYALNKFEKNQTLCLSTHLAKFLNYDWELAYMNEEKAYELFEQEMLDLKLNTQEIKEALNILDIEIDEDLSDEYSIRVIAQEIFRFYLEGERSSCLIGTFDEKIENLIRKYFFSYSENLKTYGNSKNDLKTFIKEKEIDLLKVYFAE